MAGLYFSLLHFPRLATSRIAYVFLKNRAPKAREELEATSRNNGCSSLRSSLQDPLAPSALLRACISISLENSSRATCESTCSKSTYLLASGSGFHWAASDRTRPKQKQQ